MSAIGGWKVLVTARAFADSGQNAMELLNQRNCNVQLATRFGPLPLEDLIQQARDCDAIIAATDPYCEAAFSSLPKLKLVARCGVGIDSVDLSQATQHGILITNVPNAMTDAVADYCLGLLLTMVRRIHDGFNCMIRGGWEEFPGVELRGKTLGLVGFGKIGRAVADRGLAFGLRVLTYDPQLPPHQSVTDFPQVRTVSLEELYRDSDFISIHAPNNASTKQLIDKRALEQMKSSCYLINTSRGALIDEPALIEALHAGRIAGAAIDVYCQEPLPSEHPLRSTPRLLLTPHNAFNSREAAQRMSLGCALPIVDLLDGRQPEFVCNPQVLGKARVSITNYRTS